MKIYFSIVFVFLGLIFFVCIKDYREQKKVPTVRWETVYYRGHEFIVAHYTYATNVLHSPSCKCYEKN